MLILSAILILLLIVFVIPSPKVNWKGFDTQKSDEDWWDRMNNL